MSNFRDHKEAITQAILEWHAALDHQRGARAQLRRARDPGETFYVRASWLLAQKLGRILELSEPQRQRIVPLAGLLSHLKSHAEVKSLGVQLAVLKELRFRRLLKCRERDDLYSAFITCIPLLKGQADMFQLASDFFYWNERVRKHWAEHYYLQNIETNKA